MKESDLFNRALFLTKIIRSPKQRLFTFGDTRFNYQIVSSVGQQSILRSGSLSCAKPAIITPDSINSSFDGFANEALPFVENEFKQTYSSLKVLGYQFKNELQHKENYDLPQHSLIENISNGINQNNLETVLMSAPEDVWSLALLKITFELIHDSFPGNIQDLEDRGFFLSKKQQQHREIDFLFAEAEYDKGIIPELGNKLQEYHLFNEYEDRFFELVG